VCFTLEMFLPSKVFGRELKFSYKTFDMSIISSSWLFSNLV